ncbi:Atrazine chlorohydrolase [Ensifer psoraleae]|uniref:amidohydrolase family protein n=1 Tax=Sinorhizobium psoraleae TaxID=520838 RepID=UPI001569B4C7|nr:amidohydrolase family protein [Sinorhizobium psoraleae]NRP75623.1 Atrazine chlorohydrolase [Sinorhizobium psoraleae]
MSTESPEPCDLLIHGGIVLAADVQNTVLHDGAVAIRDGRICAVGPTTNVRSTFTAEETFDAQGGVVHPGFIDAHIHVSQYTSRSVESLMAGTAITMGHWKAELTPEDEHASATMAAVDYLRAGYTGFVDPGTIFEPDAVAVVAHEVGIRIWLTDPYVADYTQPIFAHEPDLVSAGFLGRWPGSTDAAIKRLGSQLYRNGDADALVKAFIGIYGGRTSTETLWNAALAIAREHNVQFQEHRGYNPTEYLDEEASAGRSMIARLQDAGALGPGSTFVHMNVIHREDVARLGGTGTSIVWCPFQQMRAMGIGRAEPRMVEIARAGAVVTIATDIPRSFNFDALGSVAVCNAAGLGIPVTADELFRMRTIAAAESVGAGDEVGSLESGKRADVVVREPASSEALGLDPYAETAVVGMTRPPALTIVNGEIVLRHGQLLRADAIAAALAARASVKGLLVRVGLAG